MQMSSIRVGEVEKFKYLGFLLQKNGGIEEDMKH